MSKIQAGQIVHTVDGGLYRCVAKIASSEGASYRLTDLQGRSVPTPTNFRPIGSGLARFAAWLRLVAYNKDFDLYVKEYIKAAGLPIDSDMNWSRFFAAKIAPRLMSSDDEVRDEAIHHIIINALVERNVLGNFKNLMPKGLEPEGLNSEDPEVKEQALRTQQQALYQREQAMRSVQGDILEIINRFPPHIKELPLEKQVTRYLMQVFNWRVDEANRYIKNFIFQNETNSMWAEGEEEGEDTNLLDTPSKATGRGAYDAVDNDIDISAFRTGFEAWLYKKVRSKTAIQYLTLFDIIYSFLREGYVPKRSELVEQWKDEMGTEKSLGWFKVLFSNLPKLINLYVTKELKGAVNPFIEIMQNISKAKPRETLEPVHASLFGGLKIAEEFPINHEIESPPSGSSDSGSGGMSLPDLAAPAGEAGEAAAGAGEALEALAPLAMAAASKKAVGAQWELPKCKGCGSSKEPADCPACHEKFCGDCMLNHHANNPSHDRIASKVAAALLKWKVAPKSWPSASYASNDAPAINLYADKPYNKQTVTSGEAKIKVQVADWLVGLTEEGRKKMGAFKWRSLTGKFSTLAEAKAAAERFLSNHPEYREASETCYPVKPKQAAMDSEDYAFHDMDTALDLKNIIKDVIGSGLFEEKGEPYFSWSGCDYCGTGQGRGVMVSDYKGFRNLGDAQAPNRDEKEYDFRLCGECLNKLYYGDLM